MPLKELRYAFFGTWLCPKTRFDPINTEHSALCKQDINKIINKTISSYRKPNFFWSIIPTFTEYHYVILSLGLPMSKMWIVETLTYIFKETKEKISVEIATQVLNENARKPLSIGYLAFSLCSDILAALSVF